APCGRSCHGSTIRDSRLCAIVEFAFPTPDRRATPVNSPVSRHTLEAKYRKSKIWNGVLVAVIAFLGIVVVAQMLPGQSPTTTPEASDSDSSQQAGGDMEFVRRDADDPKAIGDVDAPVVMTEWIDLRCPFCASFARESLPQLIEEYASAVQVRIEYPDGADFGVQSDDASAAAQAAAHQDKYTGYVCAVFDGAPEDGHAALTRDILIDYAEQVDVPDMDAFTADVDDPA